MVTEEQVKLRVAELKEQYQALKVKYAKDYKANIKSIALGYHGIGDRFGYTDSLKRKRRKLLAELKIKKEKLLEDLEQRYKEEIEKVESFLAIKVS